MTRKEFRKQTADNIKAVCDFGDSGAIQCTIGLVRDALAKNDTKSVEKWLKHIEQCCVLNHARNCRNHHAMEMMYHFALSIGDEFDPMY